MDESRLEHENIPEVMLPDAAPSEMLFRDLVVIEKGFPYRYAALLIYIDIGKVFVRVLFCPLASTREEKL